MSSHAGHPAGGGEQAVYDPATGAEIGRVRTPGSEEVDDVVACARAAFPAWGATGPSERADVLRRAADAIEAEHEHLAQLETANVGKPISDARAEAAMAADVFRYYAGAIDKFYGHTIPVDGGVDMTFHEPLGVVAVIVPWNFPLAIAAWKAAPALAAGNTVIVKPATLTPLTAVALDRLLRDEVGLPRGVLTTVPGTGGGAGEQLIRHPDVAKISFTGSTEVGKRVVVSAAASLKRFTLELGGKSASVVFADADLEAAAAAAPAAVFGNAGQDCCARSRLLVQRAVFDEFVELFAAASARLRVGDPQHADTQMGPLISSDRVESVASFVDRPAAFVGAVCEGPGNWFPPTILAPVANDDRVAREEVFGPIAAVIPFDDERDAIRLANDTRYGLSGSIWTRDGARALRVARAIDSGSLSVNSSTSVRVSTPFGGFKESGLGRELGLAGLQANSELKNVFVATDG